MAAPRPQEPARHPRRHAAGAAGTACAPPCTCKQRGVKCMIYISVVKREIIAACTSAKTTLLAEAFTTEPAKYGRAATHTCRPAALPLFARLRRRRRHRRQAAPAAGAPRPGGGGMEASLPASPAMPLPAAAGRAAPSRALLARSPLPAPPGCACALRALAIFWQAAQFVALSSACPSPAPACSRSDKNVC